MSPEMRGWSSLFNSLAQCIGSHEDFSAHFIARFLQFYSAVRISRSYDLTL